MRVRVTRQNKGSYASIATGVAGLSAKFWERAAAVVEGGILDNILTQKKASGGALKKNKPATLARKLMEGKPPLALVDALHRFIQGKRKSWTIVKWLPRPGATGSDTRTAFRGIVVGPATAELRKLIQYVGQKGYVGYIGISKTTASALKALLRLELREKFRKSRGLVTPR